MTRDRPGEKPAGDTTLLEAILAALERGEDPDPEALKASHPERSVTIDRLIAAAGRYFSSLRSVGGVAGAIPSLQPGDRLGDFEVVGLLGRGGEGEVYHARQLSLGGREVALKALSPGLRGPHARSRFEREALILADLHHPHLAEVHGFGEDRGLLFIAMRLVEGVSLRGVLERLRAAGKGAPDRTARRVLVRWIAQVCDALSLVHAKGLVHRDVKPSNIIVEESRERGRALPEGRAVLVDFGLARPVVGPALTRTGQGAATPEYAPPEQLVGAEVDARADVFALGATLHDLLSGRMPGERPQASAGLPPLETLLEDVDRDLFAVVGKAIETDPARRYADAGALLRDLRAWEEGREVLARRQKASERIVRWVRSHPRRILRIAAGAASLLLLTVGLQAYGRYAAAAKEAKDAYAAADPLGFVRAATAVPPLLRPILLRDRDLRRSFERMTRGSAEEVRPLADVATFLEEDDFGGGILAAATEIRLLGPSADPLAERFLLSTLHGEGSRADPDGFSARRSAALRATARLFYESPAQDPGRLAAVGPLRDAVLDVLQDRSPSREDRLFALTALSGCGVAEDAAWLIDWSLGQAESTEERRLGLACTERIVRRAHRMGHLDRLDLPYLRGRCAPLVRESWDGRWTWGVASSGTELAIGFAVELLASALALASRAAGEEVPWGSTIPEGLERAALENGCLFPPAGKGELYVATRIESLIAQVRSGSPRTGVLTRPFWLGVVCGLAGDPELVRVARGRMADPEQVTYLEDRETSEPDPFEAGFAKGAALRRGENLPYLLDEDTLLGARSAEGPTERVLWTRGPGEEPPPPDSWALWDFTVDPPHGTGSARAASVRHGDLRPGDAGRTFLRLSRFGDSELRVRFVIASPFANRQWYLYLEHQPAYRVYYPFLGEAFMEIRLDGKLLDGRYRASASESPRAMWHLPSDLMTAGEHELVIRLDAATTTTYRIEQVRIREAD